MDYYEEDPAADFIRENNLEPKAFPPDPFNIQISNQTSGSNDVFHQNTASAIDPSSQSIHGPRDFTHARPMHSEDDPAVLLPPSNSTNYCNGLAQSMDYQSQYQPMQNQITVANWNNGQQTPAMDPGQKPAVTDIYVQPTSTTAPHMPGRFNGQPNRDTDYRRQAIMNSHGYRMTLETASVQQHHSWPHDQMSYPDPSCGQGLQGYSERSMQPEHHWEMAPVANPYQQAFGTLQNQPAFGNSALDGAGLGSNWYNDSAYYGNQSVDSGFCDGQQSVQGTPKAKEYAAGETTQTERPTFAPTTTAVVPQRENGDLVPEAPVVPNVEKKKQKKKAVKPPKCFSSGLGEVPGQGCSTSKDAVVPITKTIKKNSTPTNKWCLRNELTEEESRGLSGIQRFRMRKKRKMEELNEEYSAKKDALEKVQSELIPHVMAMLNQLRMHPAAQTPFPDQNNFCRP